MSASASRVASPRVVRLGQFATLSAANAAAVAALYWNQALVRSIGVDFPRGTDLLSLIPTMTFAGYAVGVALIAFGPQACARSTRARSASELHIGCLAIALAAAGAAPNLPTLVIASFCVGCGAAVAQRLIATAARLGGPDGAGTAIGMVLGAALAAILVVRLAGDTLADAIGWRAVLFLAAAAAAATGLLARLTRATCEPASSAPVVRGAVAALWRRSPPFRRAALQQMALFAAYNAAWMTALVEVPARERSLVVIGGGGAGLAAALAGGWIVDRLQRTDIPRAGAVVVLLAAGVLLPAAYSAPAGLSRVVLLLPGMALLDAGLQVALVANQARTQALMPAARSRLAATLTACGSLGGGIGAGAAYWLWQTIGWPGAIGVAAGAGLLGLACSLLKAADARDTVQESAVPPIAEPAATPPAPRMREAAIGGVASRDRRIGLSSTMLVMAKACTAYRGSSAKLPTSGAQT